MIKRSAVSIERAERVTNLDDQIEFWKTNKHQAIGGEDFGLKFGGKNFAHMLETQKLSREKAGALTLGEDSRRDYIASKWAVPFHLDTTSSVKALKAPVGTGKTSAICVELQRLASLQYPDANGVRWFKALIIRSTYNELRTTTLETWKHWAPDSVCKITTSPYILGKMVLPLPDGTVIKMDLEFASVQDLASAKSLFKGKEPTVIWFNEFPEIRQPVEVLQEAESRLWRYPSIDVAPIRWSGIIADFNPSVIGGDVYNYFQRQEKLDAARPDEPDEVTLYEYPPALLRVANKSDPEDYVKSRWVPNPEADYHRFNNKGYAYWENMVKKYVHDEDYIRSNVEGEWTMGTGNKSCFPSFSRRVHVGQALIDPGGPVLVGSDGGMFPGIVVGQLLAGSLHIKLELVVDDIITEDLLDQYLIPLIKQTYLGNDRWIVYHDPGNDNRASQSKIIPTNIFRSKGFEVGQIKTPDNITKIRHDAVSKFLNRRGGIIIDETCEYLIQAMSGQYQWNMPKTGDPSTKIIKPLKNRYSDIADALQYLCLGLTNNTMNGVNSFNDPREIQDRWGVPLQDNPEFLW